MSKMKTPPTYKLVGTGVLKDDVYMIPNNPSNTDWQQYQEWLADGNEPLPLHTPDEAEQIAKKLRKEELKNKLTKGNTKPLELVLAMWAIVSEHIPEATLTPEMETLVQEWIADLNELNEE